MNSSKDEYFQESVEEISKAFAMSGYDYQQSKKELNKFKNQDPVTLIKSERKKQKTKPGCRVFYVSPYDPRLQHPRKSLTKNYHLIASNPALSHLFPRANLIASSRRLPNLAEILSPTVQRPPSAVPRVGPVAPGDTGRNSGTYHCDLYTRTGKCDVCSHMVQRSFVQSQYFNGRKFAIHGRNIHSKATDSSPMKWFVYLEEDLPCHLQYVGSTVSMTSRWANTKQRCNKRDSDSTGLYKHFRDGCPHDTGPNKQMFRFSLIDFMYTTAMKLGKLAIRKETVSAVNVRNSENWNLNGYLGWEHFMVIVV